jgi:hypothetical protein
MIFEIYQQDRIDARFSIFSYLKLTWILKGSNYETEHGHEHGHIIVKTRLSSKFTKLSQTLLTN